MGENKSYRMDHNVLLGDNLLELPLCSFMSLLFMTDFVRWVISILGEIPAYLAGFLFLHSRNDIIFETIICGKSK